MSDDIHQKDKKIWNTLGTLIALILMLGYILWVINSQWPFIPAGSVFLSILTNIMFYGPMILIMIVTLEFFADKNIILRVIVIVLWAGIFIISFYPEILNLVRK